MALSTQPSQRIFRFGAFEVDLWTGELRKDGTKLKVQEQPLKVLGMLLSRPGELVSREQLREGLWSNDTFVDFDRGLNTAVRRLRDVLCDSAENPQFVETVGRRGYRFIALVSSDGAGQIETATEHAGSTAHVHKSLPDGKQRNSSEPTDLKQPTAPPQVHTNTGGRTRALAVLAVILIAAGAGGYAMYRWKSAPARASSFENCVLRS